MLLRIPNLLDADALAAVGSALAGARFVEGRTGIALEVDPGSTPDWDVLEKAVLHPLGANELVRSVYLPKAILPPFYRKYSAGMADPPRADLGMIEERYRVRADVAVTVFLSAPESYEGGDLVVRTDAGDMKYRLPRGDALLFPAGRLHGVDEVRSGERLVAVTWIQSLVRDADKRDVLLDLDIACRALNTKAPDSRLARLVNKAHGNLMRMWAEA